MVEGEPHHNVAHLRTDGDFDHVGGQTLFAGGVATTRRIVVLD